MRDTHSGRMTGPQDGSSQSWGGAPRACESFADTLPLMHDHELSLAEAAALEIHLSGCSACQARADAFESLSSVLKRFDAHESRLPVPHLRIQHEVLARVAEHGAHRRAATRTLRIVRIATAAAVLVAIGLGAVLGMERRSSTERSAGVGSATSSDRSPRRPAALVALAALPPRAELPPLVSAADAPGRLIGARWLAEFRPLPAAPQYPALGDSALGHSARSQATLDSLRFIASVRDEVAAMEARIGGPATVWFGLDGSSMHLMGRDALEYLRSSGGLAQMQADLERINRAVLTTSSPAIANSIAKERPVDVLTRAGLRLRQSKIMDGMDGVPFDSETRVGIRSGALTAGILGRGLKTQHGGAMWVVAEDPITLQANGKLRMAEIGPMDRVMLFVEPTDKGVLLPDGQLIIDGVKDRVVAEPVWIPASREAQQIVVRCRVVQRGVRRQTQTSPQLSPWIAGPTIRSLLRRNASSETILDAIAAQLRMADPVRFGGGAFTTFSLADLPNAMPYTKQQSFGEYVARHRASTEFDFREGEIQGFIVESANSKDAMLYGAEVSRIRGKAGAKLMSRLYQSYVLEALVIGSMQRNETFGTFHRPAPARAAYQLLRNDRRGLSERVSSDGERARTMGRAIRVADDYAVQIKVLEVEGTPALVSVTSDGARELK